MKKIVLSVAALFAFAFSNAQETTSTGGGFSQGDMFISGSVGFSTTKDGDLKTNTFTVAPRAAYFVTPNIALGLKVGYTSTSSEEVDFDGGFPTSYTAKQSAYEVGAFGRYYFTPASKFSIFGELGVAFAGSKTKYEDIETGFGTTADVDGPETTGFNIVLAPGLSYFVSEHLALEATFGILGYETAKVKDSDISTDTFGIGLNMEDINFGIVYKF